MQTGFDGRFIEISVHNNDPMKVTEYDNAISAFILGYLSGATNESLANVDSCYSTILASYQAEKIKVPLDKINIFDPSWNSAIRSIIFDATPKFACKITGANYNMAAVLIENNVTLDNNNLEIDNSVAFTYKFSPTFVADNFTGNQNTDLELKSNLVINLLELKTTKNLTVDVFDATGKLILTQMTMTGNQAIDVSNYSNGLHFIKSIDDQNQQSTFKFFKN